MYAQRSFLTVTEKAFFFWELLLSAKNVEGMCLNKILMTSYTIQYNTISMVTVAHNYCS